jgi:hypothetical protein
MKPEEPDAETDGPFNGEPDPLKRIQIETKCRSFQIKNV